MVLFDLSKYCPGLVVEAGCPTGSRLLVTAPLVQSTETLRWEASCPPGMTSPRGPAHTGFQSKQASSNRTADSSVSTEPSVLCGNRELESSARESVHGDYMAVHGPILTSADNTSTRGVWNKDPVTCEPITHTATRFRPGWSTNGEILSG